jgi:hypothetical protein
MEFGLGLSHRFRTYWREATANVTPGAPVHPCDGVARCSVNRWDNRDFSSRKSPVIPYDACMKTTTLPLRNLMNRSLLRAFLLTALALACFALSPIARAVTPAPDGGYPNENTAEGEDALFSLTTGSSNTAIGYHALHNSTTGIDHTAIGSEALASLSAGAGCTAVGSQALSNDVFGGDNTAIGSSALHSNTTGALNTAVGFNTMVANTIGSNNTATGLEALSLNTTGGANSAYGFAAINNNTTGNNNTAVGTDALQRNTTGSNNIALGSFAGFAILDGSFNIDIGNLGKPRDSFTMRIGKQQMNTYIAGISGVTVAGGLGVVIDTDGHLGTATSSARYKENIKPMDKASEAILALKPVTFRYKQELDPKGIPQFGLVAEQVEKVDPDLVARDSEGKPYTVRYEAVNAMLLNEFLKEHQKVEQLEKQVAALTEGLQKVSAQFELSKSAPQTVLNNQ